MRAERLSFMARRQDDPGRRGRESDPSAGATGGFNPLSDVLVEQFSQPSDLASINLRVLSPFQRALLVIDGTVTKFIEAYTLEPVEVLCLAHERRQLSEPHELLATEADTQVISRQVLIQGRFGRRPYVYAVSLVVPGRLPDSVAEDLEAEGAAIGRVFRAGSLETRREVLWYRREVLDDLPPAVRDRAGTEFLTRTYRIIMAGEPVALIKESFPIGQDEGPSPI